MYTRAFFKNLFFFLFLTACSQAHLISIAVASPDHDAKSLPSGSYTLDKNHASLTLKVSHLGLSNYTMQFTHFDAKLNFDSKNPEKSKLTATVYTDSIETNYPGKEKDFDKELAYSSSWFNAKKYPKAVFRSNKIQLTGKNTGKVYGELSFLGITQPLILDVTFNGGYEKKPFVGLPALGFSAQTSLTRSLWGLSTYVPAIGDNVDIHIECEFHKNPNE